MTKIIEGIKNIGAPYEIPNCGRPGLIEFFKDMGFKVGAEIGVSKGLYSEQICKEGIKLYAIDPWTAYSDYDKDGLQEEMDRQYEEAKKRLSKYDCIILKKNSMDALADIEDESLDFVFIDGNHGFKYVTEDIFEWSKKVKKGGVIAGHDYIYTDREFDNIHVKYVVNAYTKAFNINPWYILGSTGEKGDKFRCYMWIK